MRSNERSQAYLRPYTLPISSAQGMVLTWYKRASEKGPWEIGQSGKRDEGYNIDNEWRQCTIWSVRIYILGNDGRRTVAMMSGVSEDMSKAPLRAPALRLTVTVSG